MPTSKSACASRKQPPNTSGTDKGPHQQRLLSGVYKRFFSALRYSHHVINVCQVMGDVKNIMAKK